MNFQIMIPISGVEEVDFGKGDETSKLINDYINNSTKDLIQEIVLPSSINDATKLMIVNAIYFSGKWEMQFKTKPMKFTVEDNMVKNVEGMNIQANFNQRKINSQNGEDIGVLEIPYKDEDFAMYLILPPADNDVRNFNWSDINFNDLKTEMKSDLTELQLPKFKLEYQMNLKGLFQRLGANDAFSPAGKIDT